MVWVATEVVVWLAVVLREPVGVLVDSIASVVVELSPLLSAATMISPTASPTTNASKMPIVQRARVFTDAMLAEGPADDLERLVDLRLPDDQRRQQAQRVVAYRVDDQAFG